MFRTIVLAAVVAPLPAVAVEMQIADTVAAMAEPVEKGVLMTGKAEEKLAALDPLITRRLSIHQRRIALLHQP